MAPKQALSIVLMALMVSGVVFGCLGTGKAEPIPTPSVPEFTAQFIDTSHNVTSIDPYSGQQVTELVTNKTIEFTIKNQPYVTTYSQTFYYNIRMKGHYSDSWTNVSTPSLGLLNPSTSENTVYSYPASEFYNAPEAYEIGNFWFQPLVGADSAIDVQVEALIGSFQPYVNPEGIASRWSYYFVGTESGWSNTKTISIPANASTTPSTATAPTVTSNPDGTQNSPLTWLIVGVVVGLGAVVALLVVIVGFMRRRIRVLEHKMGP
jgi:hypothetical protein